MTLDLAKLAALSDAARRESVSFHTTTTDGRILFYELANSIDALVAECLAAREWLRQEQISSGLVSDVRACAGGEINQACEAYRKLVAGEGT